MFFSRRKLFKVRYKWVKPSTMLAISFLLLFLLVIPVLSGDYDELKKMYNWAGLQEDNTELLLAEMLPGCKTEVRYKGDWEGILKRLIAVITGVSSSEPAAILGGELNLIWYSTALGFVSDPRIIEEGGEEDFYLPGQDESLDDWIAVPLDEFPPVQLNGEPMVLVYNTHNAESYKPSDGTDRMEGKNGGVAAVSKTLTQALESKYGLRTIYCDAIHDYPDWTKSYINSMYSVQQLLKKYTKIQMVIDIHRDAGLNSRSDTLVRIGNKNYAKVMIVVGTEHPRWKENLAFAEKVEAKANKLYPGLIKCTRVLEDRRYNQHLHPRALLLEFGSDLNTREDATNSAVLMAEIIAATLKGN